MRTLKLLNLVRLDENSLDTRANFASLLGDYPPKQPVVCIVRFFCFPQYRQTVPGLGEVWLSSTALLTWWCLHVHVNAMAPTALSTCYCFILVWILLRLKSSSLRFPIYLAQETARLGISSLYCSLETVLTVSWGNHRPRFTSLFFQGRTAYCLLLFFEIMVV